MIRSNPPPAVVRSKHSNGILNKSNLLFVSVLLFMATTSYFFVEYYNSIDSHVVGGGKRRSPPTRQRVPPHSQESSTLRFVEDSLHSLGQQLTQVNLQHILTKHEIYFHNVDLYRYPLLKNATRVVEVLHNWHQFVVNAKDHLAAALDVIEEGYSLNNPFPHMYYDNLFPADLLEMVLEEIPEVTAYSPEGCPIHCSRCWKTDKERKGAINADFPFFTSQIISFMKSSNFIDFLELLTNVTMLLPDPHNFGAGVHQIAQNGFLNIHADFNNYPNMPLYRRVNAFLFLNPDWKDEYGGHLELWSSDLTQCKPILPQFGRLVIFSTNDFSFHGHPHPLNCPEDRTRRSIAQYYYTLTRPLEDCENMNCSFRAQTKWVVPPRPCFESELIP